MYAVSGHLKYKKLCPPKKDMTKEVWKDAKAQEEKHPGRIIENAEKIQKKIDGETWKRYNASRDYIALYLVKRTVAGGIAK